MRTPDIIWPKTIDRAREIQERDKKLLLIKPLDKEPEYVAGVDAAFSEDRVYAAACLYCYPQLTIVEQAAAEKHLAFPYIPGYLLFREGPAIIAALNKLKRKPDVILIDGQGIAHPRGIGSASHLGILLDVPTIGCGKTKLVGKYRDPGELKGNWTELLFNGQIVGAVLRTRDSVRPLFVSPGHRIDLQGAIRIALACVGRYRIPEPLRSADMLSTKTRSLNLRIRKEIECPDE